MYRPELRRFAFRLRRRTDGHSLEGTSDRYTAIVLIGLAAEDPSIAREILQGNAAAGICGELLSNVGRMTSLGDVSLVLWAAREWGLQPEADAQRAFQKLAPDTGRHPTVEIAWALAALVAPPAPFIEADLARRIAERLVASFRESSELFPHWPDGTASTTLRSHVTCFADFVYPVHALSKYGAAARDAGVLKLIRRCADRMCALQGPDGQWWWHFDVRTGRVIERYPVYAVHQDAMAPMALAAAAAACGANYDRWIARGLDWLSYAPEIHRSLVDQNDGVIWRKVARREPPKLSRSIQAAASRLHPNLRVPLVPRMCPPTRVDWESRPYHMGWILYAMPTLSRLLNDNDPVATHAGSRSPQLADSTPV